MDRKILPNGTSIVDIETAMSILLKDGELPEHIKIEPSETVDMFRAWYGIDVSGHVDYTIPKAEIVGISDLEYERLTKKIQLPRDDTPKDVHFDRVKMELEWFERTENLKFLPIMVKLIERFKEENVIWGIGRGSSVASYVLYLLEVHDVNPIKYNIGFNEFSKEDEVGCYDVGC